MTLSERIAANKSTGNSLSERIAAKKAQPKRRKLRGQMSRPRKKFVRDPNAPQPNEPYSWRDKVIQLAKTGTLGAADELALGPAALAAYTFGDSADSLPEIYNDMQQQQTEQQKAYEADFPSASRQLNILGGFLTAPLSASATVPKAAVPFGEALRYGQALRRGAGVAPRMGTRAKEAVQGAVAATGNAVKGTQIGRGAAIGGAEGGAMNFFGADDWQEGLLEVPQGVALGTTLGGTLSSLGRVGRGVLNQSAKRRTAQELGEGDNFIPLNIADPQSVKGMVTRDVTGKAFGSKIPEQSEQVMARVQSTLNQAKKRADDAKSMVDEGKTKFKRVADAKAEKVAFDENKTAADIAATENKQINAQASRAERDIKETAANNVRTSEVDLRRQAEVSAIPPGTSPEVVAQIQRAGPQEANELITNEWKRGFNTVKERTFTVDTDEVLKDITEDVGGMGGADDYLAGILKAVKTKLDAKTVDGIIPGSDLMDTRNMLRVQANNAADSGASAIHKEALSRAARKIDDRIEEQLGPELADAFRAEKTAYGNFNILNNASKKAVAKKQGAFTQDDWLAAEATWRPRQARQGQAPLQRKAQTAQDMQRDIKAQAAEATTQVKAKAAGRKEDVGVTEAAAKRKTKLAKTLRRAEIADAAKGKANVDDVILSGKAAREAEKLLKAAAPGKESFLARAAATGVLALSGSVGGIPGMLASGAGGARALSAEGVQRALAGQTGWQKKLAELLRQYEGSAVQQAAGNVSSGTRRALQSEIGQ